MMDVYDMDRWVDRWVVHWMERCVYGWMLAWMDGEGWLNKRKENG